MTTAEHIHWLEHWLDDEVTCGVTREFAGGSLEVNARQFVAFAESQEALGGPLVACVRCRVAARLARAVQEDRAKREGVGARVLPPSGFQRSSEKDSVVAEMKGPGRPKAAGPHEGVDQ